MPTLAQCRAVDPRFERTVLIRDKHFAAYMEKKIEQLFAEAIGPVLCSLQQPKDNTHKREKDLQAEFSDTDPNRILCTTRDCGTSSRQRWRTSRRA